MASRSKTARARLLCSGALASLTLWAGVASAQDAAPINIPPQSLSSALYSFAGQSGNQVMFTPDVTGVKTTQGVSGVTDRQEALRQLLLGTGLTFRREGDTFLIVQVGEGGSGPQAAGAGDNAVQALIVTAQKREENIQDVPIAISAFSQRDLEAQKIEGGPDLMRGVPNLTFSKSNFTSYNLSIRGIGTKAVSASTDPGVAVSFNNVGLIVNRFFEQEFFDVERVEVLRGPQGTLYGRNATGGVVNIISAKPKLSRFEASIKGEVGNYDSRRLVGMVNVPLIEDVLGIRIAGAATQRDGYDYNSITENRINGRDLWSLRTTVAFEPTPWLRANLIWERFEEDDNRSRTGKQLCHRDDSPEMIGSTPVNRVGDDPFYAPLRGALFSTGCKAGSLYDEGAFGTPNGRALAYVSGINTAQLNFAYNFNPGFLGNLDPEGFLLNPFVDPYGGAVQSRDLREVASIRDPRYRANSDILELNVDIDLSENLTLSSQSVLSWDEVYSFQDFNRFNTIPIFQDTSNWVEKQFPGSPPSRWRDLAPGGVLCDPQIGCSDRLAVFDISSSKSKQFSQEVRLQSDFDGPFNFSIGGNYTDFKTQNDYYVMSNLLTAMALLPPFNTSGNIYECTSSQWTDVTPLPSNPTVPIRDSFCPYIDPNPVESINGDGHNYFRSSNPYKLKSYAAFGEAYYEVSPDLKLTAGLRYTHDDKRFTLVPSQLLLAPTMSAGGLVGTGYPAAGDIVVEGGEYTWRLAVDWKPELSFTDDTLLYASYSRGYKAGGINPPTPGFATDEQLIAAGLTTQAEIDLYTSFNYYLSPILELTAVNYGPTFEPELVDAFEIGAKNTLMDGRLTLNAGAFFYDYKAYQVSQIRDRTAVNENFDAEVWGAELSALFEPIDRLRFNANLGYLNSHIGEGMRSIDPMNRALGNPDYVVVKPWVQLPSNCVIPVHMAEYWLDNVGAGLSYKMCGGLGGFLAGLFGGADLPDTLKGGIYDTDNYPELNDGAGLYTELEGNELPNAPHWTVNVGTEYGRDILDGSWRVTLRGDAYWQSQSWARVYNLDPYDKLHGWYNLNISVRLTNDDLGLEGEFYVKNLLDKSPITDAFLNSDDTGLTTNVFVLDPRLVGFSLRKTF